MIYGRDAERSHLADVVEAARAGMSSALVVRGAAGSGKSALLDDLAAAAGMRTLRALGVESESELAFAGLRQMLDPLLGLLDDLTPSRGTALASALGIGETRSGSDPFLVAAAVLDLLATAAERGPLLAIADDAHWLDGASQDALLFVARRLGGEGIALIFAAGEGNGRSFEAPGVPRLELGGLDPAAASALVEERGGTAPTASVAARLVAETGGNPLALAELAETIDAPSLRGEVMLPDPLPLARGAEAAFLERVRLLPESARAVLLLMAVEPAADLALLARAGAKHDDLDAAVRAGLVHLDDEGTAFAHPLVRSAVEAGATFAQRQQAHLALAAALPDAERERRAWHAAAAALEPDDELADELELLARRALERSGNAAAQAALTRAAELTEDPGARGRRLVAAADAAWHAGRASEALALIERASPLVEQPREHALAASLRGVITLRTGSLDDAHRLLMDAARETAEIETEAAYALVGEAANAGALAGDPVRLIAAGELASSFAEPVDAASRLIRRAVVAFGEFAGNGPAACGAELRAISGAALRTDDPGLMTYGVTAARLLGDERLAARLLSRAERIARSATMIEALPFFLVQRAAADYDAGRLAGAAAAADEGARLARESGQTTILAAGLAHVARTSAVRGDATRFATAEPEATALAVGHGLTQVESIAAHASALHEIGLGRYEAAAEALERIAHPALAASRASDACEVAVHLDRPGDALAALVELESLAARLQQPWIESLLERARGVTATTRGDRHFLRAIALQGEARPFERARTELAFGETLRRAPRRVDARAPLRRALETFERVGAEPWAARADRELRATGETSRHRPVLTQDRLTPQELAICELVAWGLANREIGARLFLSPGTIDHHLRKIYPKLGIGSREELVLLDLGADEHGEHLAP